MVAKEGWLGLLCNIEKLFSHLMCRRFYLIHILWKWQKISSSSSISFYPFLAISVKSKGNINLVWRKRTFFFLTIFFSFTEKSTWVNGTIPTNVGMISSLSVPISYCYNLITKAKSHSKAATMILSVPP